MSILDTYQFRRAEISLGAGLPCAPDAERMILGVVCILVMAVLDQAVERLTWTVGRPVQAHHLRQRSHWRGQGSAIDRSRCRITCRAKGAGPGWRPGLHRRTVRRMPALFQHSGTMWPLSRIARFVSNKLRAGNLASMHFRF